MVPATGLANVPSDFQSNWSCFAVVYKRSDQDNGSYTCIDLWHVSEPQNKFIGTFGTGDTITWYQDYNTSLLTNSALLSPLASALGALMARQSGYNGSLNDLIDTPGVYSFSQNATDKPFTYGILIVFPRVNTYTGQIAINISSGVPFAVREGPGAWKLFDSVQ